MQSQNPITSIAKTLLPSFVLKIGLSFLILAITAFSLSPLLLKEPLNLFFEHTANHLSYTGKNAWDRSLGKLLLQIFPTNDWKSPDIRPQLNTRSQLDWQGQGASKHIVFAPQQYKDKKPLNGNKLRVEYDTDKTNHVSTSKELIYAITHAKAGDIIQLRPGTYQINHNISVVEKGEPSAPITVRSAQLGSAKINFKALDGFYIDAPYWVFENLEIQGLCEKNKHSACEHAFHVVGNAHSFVLRNNIIYDFNASLKVNGQWVKRKLIYPDYGLVENNSFFNTTPRNTSNPVTLLNINNVNHWVVRNNYIADFSKAMDDHTSYGTFMKGNGKNGLYENNLIICEHTLAADQGLRISLSFGGGGTNKKYCREQNCDIEHSNGVIRNNIILNCSHDVGIYLNKSNNTQIYNNLIFNSLGIDIHFKSSSATVFNNIISGRIKTKDDGIYHAKNNLIDMHCVAPDRQFEECSFKNWYQDIINADTRLTGNNTAIIGKGVKAMMDTDFCNNPIAPDRLDIGPIQYSNQLTCLPTKMNLESIGSSH